MIVGITAYERHHVNPVSNHKSDARALILVDEIGTGTRWRMKLWIKLQLDRVCTIPAKTPDEVMAATWARVEKSMLSRLWKKDVNFHMLCLYPARILAPFMICYLTDHLLGPEPHMPGSWMDPVRRNKTSPAFTS